MKIPTMLILALLIVAVIIGGYLLISPKKANVNTIQNQVKEKEQAVTTKEKEAADLKEIEANLKTAQTQVKDIPSVLPKGDQIPELLIQLDALAKDSSLGLNSVNLTPGTETEKALYQTMNISATVIGSYTNLKTYLDAVEKNMRLLDVTSIDFSATPVVPEAKEIFSYTVNMKTYYIE